MSVNKNNEEPTPIAANSAEQLRQIRERFAMLSREQFAVARHRSLQFYTPIEAVRAMVRVLDSPAAAAHVADSVRAAGGLAHASDSTEAFLREWSALLTAAKAHQLIFVDEAHGVSLPPTNVPIKAKSATVRAPTVKPKIALPPAHRLASVLRYVLTKGAYKRTVEPHLVDLYDEYSELIKKGEETRAKWVILRGHVLVLWSLLKRPIIALTGWLSTPKD